MSKQTAKRGIGAAKDRQTMARQWWVSFLLLSLLSSSNFPSLSSAQQLSSSQTKTLFRLQRILERPPALRVFNNSTDLCSLQPSPTLSLSCSGHRVTALSISGDAASQLSPTFSIDSLFTTLAHLPNLTALSLVSLGLWGPLPSKVDRLRSLQVLNLSSNYIAGEIPREISKMASLQSLVLDGNRLNGSVPGLGSLPALQEVNLAGNRLGPGLPVLGGGVVTVVLRNNSFSSSIPPSLFSLPSIEYLDLSHNLLAGELPASSKCAAGLRFVDVSGNRLVGSLPACMRYNSSGKVVLDAGNCLSSGDSRYQHRNSYCNEGAIAAVIPTAEGREQTKRKKNEMGVILGVVGGVVGGAALLGVLLLVVLKRARRRVERGQGGGGGQLKPTDGKASPVPATPGFRARAMRMGTLGLTPHRVFSMEELEEATNGFDPANLVQGDGRCQTYRGWLDDGSNVIIRRLRLKQRHLPQQSLAQFVETISKVRHRHLVSILGHCIDGDQENANSSNSVYLILEHISSGTLRSRLTAWRKGGEVLKWPQRVAAAIGVARGIHCLHTVTVPGISGNDLSMENILLDESLAARISNYNLPMVSMNRNHKGASESPFAASEESDLSRNVHGVEHGEKEDIYQLGAILLEIITGKPFASHDELVATKIQLQRSLADEQGRLSQLVDTSIRGTVAHDSLRTAAEIALGCLSNDLSRRPSIDDIIWNLQYSVQVQDGWASNNGSFRSAL